jgi:hypothetical protein
MRKKYVGCINEMFLRSAGWEKSLFPKGKIGDDKIF